MLYYWLLFFFVAFGAKALLALVMIYLLLPRDRTCSRCDRETVLVHHGGLGLVVSGFFLGRVQRRWCPACGWEGLAQRVGSPAEPSAVSLGAITRAGGP